MRTLLLPIVLSYASTLSAQQYYSFVQVAEPYQEIASGTTVTFAGGFGQINALNGETFPITGAPFLFGGAKQLWVLDGGALNIDYAPVNTVFVSGLFDGFGGLVVVDGTSSVKYLVTGPAGDRTLTVQWKNMRRTDGVAGHFVNFQIALHQTTGVIEMRYGPHENGNTTYTAANGPNAGFYFADYNASVVYDRIWLTGNSTAPAQSTALAPNFTGLTTIPADGTVYRFTPTWLTSIAEVGDAHLGVWPVPAADLAYFTLPFAGSNHVSVHDAAGRCVSRFTTMEARVELDLRSFAPGPYTIAVIDQGVHRAIGRLLVEGSR